MLTVDQAIDAILATCRTGPARPVALADALGLVLAEPIAADIDLPPFDKALMDGYAVRSADLAQPGEHRLRVVEEISAGQVSTRPLAPGEAARIMTGAPLPPGADAVVMLERSRMDGPDVILGGPVASGLARLSRGREMVAGEALLPGGSTLDATRLGLIASAGRPAVLAIPRPGLTIVPTGNELVPPAVRPGPGQIRNTNGVMLATLARTWGAGTVNERPIVPDDPAALRMILGEAIASSAITLISGGVSAGSKDLVPPTLTALGVATVFHKIRLKPGKPLWFGVAEGSGGLVFGLPGNPVSSLVCFLLFVRPALQALAGVVPTRTQPDSFPLALRFEHRGDRPTYHPARLDGGRVLPLDWAGSADLRTVALADGFATFPAGDQAYEAGESIGFLPIR